MARYAPAAYTSAQTDTIVVAVATGFRFVITGHSCMIDNACTVSVSYLLEFDDVTDVRIFEHKGIAPGFGVVEKGSALEPIAEGDDGQDVLVTLSVPTGGNASVTVNGFLQPTS